MKKGKIIGLIISLIVFLYGMLVVIDVVRFNNKAGVKPLILLKDEIFVSTEATKSKSVYKGFGYTMEYEYLANQEEGSDHVLMTLEKGKMTLFGIFTLNEWIA